MSEYVFSIHARDMLRERGITEQQALQAISTPDDKRIGTDGNMHYFMSLPELDNRTLHVVVNETVEPNRIITLFLDRRRRTK